MTKFKVLLFPRCLKRFRPAFFGVAAIMLFLVLVKEIQKPNLIVHEVFARARNASNVVVKMNVMNDCITRTMNISSITSRVKELSNSTLQNQRLPSVTSDHMTTLVHKTNNLPNIQSETNPNELRVWKNNQSTCSEDFKFHHFMTVYIMGRAGNQLFQLCTLIATADDSCYTAFVPQSQSIGIETIFNIESVIRKEINASTPNFKKIGERGWAIFNTSIVNSIDPLKNVSLDGFFQTFKHFQHKKKLIQSSLIFKDNIVSDVSNFFRNMSLHNKTKIGIHVRRGDFLKKSNIKLGYYPATRSFILKAIHFFTNSIANNELAFIIVSDDIAWCKKNIKHKHVYFSPFKDVGRDLNILTQSDHNVVTSGSFGWMGAWLNETGTVVYDKSFPKYKSWLWWGHRKQDYYPSWWIGL